MLPGAQKMQIFESPGRQEEEPFTDIPVSIEVDVKSISAFVKKHTDTLDKMWDENQLKVLTGDDLSNFLHNVLKKWYESYNPNEKRALVKAQTKAAISDFRKLIASSCGLGDFISEIDRDTWMKFIEQMKQREFSDEDIPATIRFETLAGKIFEPSDSGSAIPSVRRGVDIVYQNRKDPSMETPIQKYRRLKSEVDSFRESLKDFAEKKNRNK